MTFSCLTTARTPCTIGVQMESDNSPFSILRKKLQRLSDDGKTLRQIANEEYGSRINHAVIQRCLNGQEPIKTEIRHVLGLPNTMPVPYKRNPITGQFEPLNE